MGAEDSKVPGTHMPAACSTFMWQVMVIECSNLSRTTGRSSTKSAAEHPYNRQQLVSTRKQHTKINKTPATGLYS